METTKTLKHTDWNRVSCLVSWRSARLCALFAGSPGGVDAGGQAASGSVGKIETESASVILVVSSSRPNQYTANHCVHMVVISRRVLTAAPLQCANTPKRGLCARIAAAAVCVNTEGFAVDAPCVVAVVFVTTVE
jgi:hypothetical protein